MRKAQVATPHKAAVMSAAVSPGRPKCPLGTAIQGTLISVISRYAANTPIPLNSAAVIRAAVSPIVRVRTGTAIALEASCMPVTKIAERNAPTHRILSRTTRTPAR